MKPLPLLHHKLPRDADRERIFRLLHPGQVELPQLAPDAPGYDDWAAVGVSLQDTPRPLLLTALLLLLLLLLQLLLLPVITGLGCTPAGHPVQDGGAVLDPRPAGPDGEEVGPEEGPLGLRTAASAAAISASTAASSASSISAAAATSSISAASAATAICRSSAIVAGAGAIPIVVATVLAVGLPAARWASASSSSSSSSSSAVIAIAVVVAAAVAHGSSQHKLCRK